MRHPENISVPVNISLGSVRKQPAESYGSAAFLARDLQQRLPEVRPEGPVAPDPHHSLALRLVPERQHRHAHHGSHDHGAGLRRTSLEVDVAGLHQQVVQPLTRERQRRVLAQDRIEPGRGLERMRASARPYRHRACPPGRTPSGPGARRARLRPCASRCSAPPASSPPAAQPPLGVRPFHAHARKAAGIRQHDWRDGIVAWELDRGQHPMQLTPTVALHDSAGRAADCAASSWSSLPLRGAGRRRGSSRPWLRPCALRRRGC